MKNKKALLSWMFPHLGVLPRKFSCLLSLIRYIYFYYLMLSRGVEIG
jgi:hypothetical protein